MSILHHALLIIGFLIISFALLVFAWVPLSANTSERRTLLKLLGAVVCIVALGSFLFSFATETRADEPKSATQAVALTESAPHDPTSCVCGTCDTENTGASFCKNCGSLLMQAGNVIVIDNESPTHNNKED